MATELARMRDMLDAARHIRDSENEWRQYDLACWVAEHAEAIEVGLRMMALPEDHGIRHGFEPSHRWSAFSYGKCRAEGYATPLEALRALDGDA